MRTSLRWTMAGARTWSTKEDARDESLTRPPRAAAQSRDPVLSSHA
jgi:hypothetical protein